MFNKVLFIVTEKHMLSNMKPMLDEFQKYQVSIHLYVSPFNPLSIINRIIKGKKCINVLKKDINKKIPAEFRFNTLIIYSNAEGFWIANKQYWLPSFVNCKEVFLQHGIMPISKGSSSVRNVINLFSSLILQYNITGKGFGSIITNYIIVYGNAYKQYLINKKGWKDNQILVSGNLFKHPQINFILNNKNKLHNSCLFLLQTLSPSYISENKFITYCDNILKDLALKYDTIILRKHPKMSIKYDKYFSDNKNVIISHETLENDILSVDHVFSFFSTALIDAAILNRKVIAIKLPEIPTNVYTTFNRVVQFYDLKKYLLTIVDNDEMANINSQYFDTKVSINDILKELLCK